MATWRRPTPVTPQLLEVIFSNTWRADSEATNTAAVRRAALGVVGRMAADAFKEFSPDLIRLIRHR